METREALVSNGSAERPVLYMAMELSLMKWVLRFSPATTKHRDVTVDAGDIERLCSEIEKAKRAFSLAESAAVKSCFEAGRDGFWIHRFLASKGVENVVVDAASIEMPRRNRRAKTDGIDVEKLLRLLIQYGNGEKDVWSVVRVPSEEDEDRRHASRELYRLKKEKTQHTNRIKGLLMSQGIRVKSVAKLPETLDLAHLWDDGPLRNNLRAEVLREFDRFRLLNKQICELEAERSKRLKKPTNETDMKAAHLTKLRGVGEVSADTLSKEVFGWRQFRNRRELPALVGLAPSPYSSGEMQRDQGISKAGRGELRALLVELAWSWVRYQPDSKLTLWFNDRFGGAGKRSRRVGIVGVARKLLIALWRYVEQGVIPEGAVVEA